jgi:peptidoglycan glycosyltransferase
LNPQLRRLFVVLCVLFTALIATATYWLWRSPDLEARQGNPTLVVRQVTIDRGLIYAADGKTILADNRTRKVEGRVVPAALPATQPRRADGGFSTVSVPVPGSSVVNDFSPDRTGTEHDHRPISDRAGVDGRGTPRVDDRRTRATEGYGRLSAACGAIVVLDVTTGAVAVMASSPTYDPNLVERRFDDILTAPGPCPDPAPLLNRATAGLFIPGSTFKVVTTAAALDSGRYEPSSEFFDKGFCVEYGKKVFNYADQDGPAVYGRVTLSEAFENSINSVFCQLGKDLGPQLILDYAKRFGFYELPPLETPDDERRPSGLYEDGRLLPGRPERGRPRAGSHSVRSACW